MHHHAPPRFGFMLLLWDVEIVNVVVNNVSFLWLMLRNELLLLFLCRASIIVGVIDIGDAVDVVIDIDTDVVDSIDAPYNVACNVATAITDASDEVVYSTSTGKTDDVADVATGNDVDEVVILPQLLPLLLPLMMLVLFMLSLFQQH